MRACILSVLSVSLLSVCACTGEDLPAARPMLLDLGATACVPCKLMAPILEELKQELAGRVNVKFVDVWQKENAPLARQYNINVIPTQIFLDAAGKELWRHQGFISKANILAKWRELNVDISPPAQSFARLTPARRDERPKSSICFMCDHDLNPKTVTVLQTAKGDVKCCTPHCYFILYSCMSEDRGDLEKKVTVADWPTGKPVPLMDAVFLYGLAEQSGRPLIRAFADKEAALRERQAAGGSLINWQVLRSKELANRCGFCDRAMYPEDGAVVKAGGVYTWGCCSHCALGVAARTHTDIEVSQPDGLTGKPIVVKTLNGSVASIDPPTAVAWFGQHSTPDGKWVSAGCFHQGFFATEDNLKQWVEQRPYATGRLISIDQALADKMKLTPTQIQKACKVGECAPK